MTGITRILSKIDQGDQQAAEQLLPLVYSELRKLAGRRLANEAPGQTLQPTALVHEAYIRLVDLEGDPCWNSRGHFFAAAAEAMRRILIESARRKHRKRHGGDLQRVEFTDSHWQLAVPADDFLVLNDALDRLEQADATSAKVVKLRYFAGLTMPQIAQALGLSLRSAERSWRYARTWLHREVSNGKKYSSL
jgi:RNA polymerase sigma factor (TIGR02999 family)